MRAQARRALEPLLAAACLILANLVSSRLYLRADLSEGGLYSLGAGSKRILSSLPGPVEIRAYFSKELPGEFAASRAYVRDMLREYRRASRGMLRYRVVDVERESDTRGEAMKAGVAPIQFNVIARDKYEVREGFMGLVVQYGDKREVLPVVSQPESLEYDLTSRVRQLTQPSKKRIGILASHGAIGPDALHPQVQEYLSRSYELVPVRLDALTSGTTLPADLAGLLLLGPSERLEKDAISALEKFLLSGRPAVLALDGKRVDLRSFALGDLDNGLGPWLASRGVRLAPNLVLDAQCQKVAVSSQRGWLTLQNVLEFPPFVVSTDLDRQHPVTRRLSELTLPFVSPIEAGPGAKVLARSSRLSWLRQAWSRGTASANPMQNWAAAPTDPKGPFALAVEVDGPGPARLLLVGTARFAQRDLPAGDSGPMLLLNLADWIAMDADLISIRSKNSVSRPLTEIPAAAKAAVRWTILLLPPLLAVGFGAFRLVRRARARRRRQELYGPPPAAAAAAA